MENPIIEQFGEFLMTAEAKRSKGIILPEDEEIGDVISNLKKHPD